MWVYEKKLQFPVNIKRTDPALAKLIMTQLGGPDGELAASTRYIHQRYSMPYRNVKALLTDIGTEEMAPIWCPSCYPYYYSKHYIPML